MKLRGYLKKKQDDKYADLPAEFKDGVEGKSDDEINAMLAKVAKDEELNRRLMKDDQDLQEKTAARKEAAEQYTEATKANKLKTSYLYDVLKARGKAE